MLVLPTTISNVVFPHDQRYRLTLYGVLFEVSWLLRLLQNKFFACGVKAECELSDESKIHWNGGIRIISYVMSVIIKQSFLQTKLLITDSLSGIFIGGWGNMTLKDRIITLLKNRDGLTDREITDALLGKNNPQQPVNQACRDVYGTIKM